MQCTSGRWKIHISSAGSGFTGQIFAGELPEVDSARILRQDEQKFLSLVLVSVSCSSVYRLSFR